MTHRRTATAAVVLSTLVLATAGCADDAGTATVEDAGTADASGTPDGAGTPETDDTASPSAVDPSDPVVAHAEAYAALVDHPAYVRVQSAEPEALPAFVDEVSQGKLKATSNGKVWTFSDVGGDCATTLSTDDTGGEIYETTCDGVVVDQEFDDALRAALAS